MPISVYPPPSADLARKRRELAPNIQAAFDAFSKSVFAEGALPAKTKQLMAVAVAHVTQCPYCISGHTKAAIRHGATPQEIMEAIWVAAEMRAGAASAHSVISLTAMDEEQDRRPYQFAASEAAFSTNILPKEISIMAQTRTDMSSEHRRGHAYIEGTLDAVSMQFDLGSEIKELRKEESWDQETGRNSKTLVKYPDLRIVLVLMKAKTRMHEHRTTARISVQTLSGHIRLHLSERTVDLPAGNLVALDQCLEHDVEALEESAFLLTISWPPGAEIEQCKTPPPEAK